MSKRTKRPPKQKIMTFTDFAELTMGDFGLRQTIVPIHGTMYPGWTATIPVVQYFSYSEKHERSNVKHKKSLRRKPRINTVAVNIAQVEKKEFVGTDGKEFQTFDFTGWPIKDLSCLLYSCFVSYAINDALWDNSPDTETSILGAMTCRDHAATVGILEWDSDFPSLGGYPTKSWLTVEQIVKHMRTVAAAFGLRATCPGKEFFLTRLIFPKTVFHKSVVDTFRTHKVYVKKEKTDGTL